MFKDVAYIGELMALTNAFLWASSVILFKVSGHSFRPFALNLFKNTIGSVCLLLTLIVMHQVWVDVTLLDFLLLLGSGIIGIAIADTLLFQSLNLLGASRSAVVDCLYAPFIMFFSYLFLREEMTPAKITGACMIIASIPLIYMDKKKDPIAPATFWAGLGYGTLAMALMGIGIVYIKPQLEAYPLVWTTSVRMIGGTLAMFVFAFFRQNRRDIFAIFRPQPKWKVALPPSFIGAYPCILLWVGSFKYAQASIAGIITQLSIFLTVFFAGIFLKEPMTLKKWLAVVIAFSGSAVATFL